MRIANGSTHVKRRGRRRAFGFARLDLSDLSTSFWTLSAFVAAVFLMGGSARPDVLSLVLLRPLAFVALGIGLLRLHSADARAHRFLFGFAAAVLLITIFYLVPLPPDLWTQLPGRDVIAEIDIAAGAGEQWRPLALSPTGARNALFSLAVPAAALVLGVQLNRREHWLLLLAVVALGVLDQLVTLLQIMSTGSAPYFYQVTNRDAGVGLFANRNHNATLLAVLLPIVAYVYVRTRAPKQRFDAATWVAAAAALVIAALLLAIGSRAGLAVGGVAVVGAMLVMSDARRGRASFRSRAVFGAVALIAIVGMGSWAAMLGSAPSITNLSRTLLADDPRYSLWPTAWRGVAEHWPIGSGPGGYEKLIQVIEPDATLRTTYSNHAHNDWLELLLTLGLPGGLLIVAAVVAFAVASVRVWRIRAGYRSTGIMGLAIILVTAIGSAVDYPLRTPILASLFVLACCWVAKCLDGDVEKAPDQAQRQS